ncbi:hypothetical protein G6F22_017523 [Rhizopus arrhizus]|nr:hypothetical protein G6F22_017523 [Rhizopus arrhizus]
MLGRDAHRFGPRHEAQLQRQQRLGLLALVLGQAIPLVDGNDQRAAGIEHGAEHGGILVGHAFGGIQHQHGHLALLDRLHGLDHRELLDDLVHARAAAQAGGIDQAVLAAVTLQVHRDRIAGGARHVGSDHALLAEDAVDQRRLAHVRAADEGDADAVRIVVQLFAAAFFGQARAHFV